MERREPTLSTGAVNDRDDAPVRRAHVDDDVRSSRGYAPRYEPAPSSNVLPAAALVIALIGVGGAGFLGWQLTLAQEMLAKDAARISQLEGQLNLTSSESTQSVSALQINLKNVDTEVKKLWDVAKKSSTETAEKFSSVNKATEGARTEIGAIKSEIGSIKQELLVNKATLDELLPRLENVDKGLADQRKRVQDVATSIIGVQSQLKATEALSARINKTEEAIDAIDDNRRNINKDLLQIKQQLGIKN